MAMTLEQAIELAKARCSAVDAGLEDDPAAYEALMAENADEILGEAAENEATAEAEREALEATDKNRAALDAQVAEIMDGLKAAGITCRVAGNGSRYIHTDGCTIRVSDHPSPEGRGGMYYNESMGFMDSHSEADVSVHPGGASVATAIETATRMETETA